MTTIATTFAAVRTLILAFLVLAGGLGASLLAPAQEAAAAGPCTVISSGSKFASNGYYYVRGSAAVDCSYASPTGQVLSVTLYRNGYAVAKSNPVFTYDSIIVVRTPREVCRSGALYQVKIVHTFNYAQTVHWSPSYRMC